MRIPEESTALSRILTHIRRIHIPERIHKPKAVIWVPPPWDREPTGGGETGNRSRGQPGLRRRPERAREEVRPGTGREASLGCGLEACLRGSYP